MKYFVNVGGREFVVELEGGRATIEGRTVDAHLSLLPGTPLNHLLLDRESCTLLLKGAGRGQWQVERWGERFEVEVVDERTRHIRSLTGAGQKSSGPPVLKAPMPGLVVRVQVEAGERVTLGAGVVVLEAMKMENELRAPAEAVVRVVHVRQGQAVEKGQVLVEFEVSSGAAG